MKKLLLVSALALGALLFSNNDVQVAYDKGPDPQWAPILTAHDIGPEPQWAPILTAYDIGTEPQWAPKRT